ncbi:MAG TPA: cysteine--tRNA ligase [Candidatus Binatia bacterium]|nr:cysteine--tRNA ligase [Candidatus Binatia bacterium]
MALHLFNTLSGKVEEFQPLEDNLVRMYVCGPTVYDYGHIGNFRTFIAVDVLRRFLKQSGYKLKHVMNITDVEDKIIRNAAQQGVTVQEYTQKYSKAFFEDADALNIEHPEMLVKATDHIHEMAHFIAELRDKGYAYPTDDGSYYFRIATFPEYGKLSKKDFAGMTDGARVDVDEYEKDNARDFALWKAPKPGEAEWETEIGPGRPGWHIECSQMSMKYLGDSFDIHAGGEDLIFPHHENEIAQSESLTGKQFVKYWVHSRFLLVEGEKMAKSAGNFYTVRDLVLMGHKPSSIRFLLMSVPHHKQLNFTFDGLTQAANSVDRLRNFKLRLQTSKFEAGSNPAVAELAATAEKEMRAGMEDDLNTARALGAIFDMVRDVNAALDSGQVKQDDVSKVLQALEQFDEIFAVLKDDDAAKVRATVEWAQAEGKSDKISVAAAEMAKAASLSDAEVEKLVAEHSQARQARNFARSDAIRAQLAENGIILENTKDGVRWKRK